MNKNEDFFRFVPEDLVFGILTFLSNGQDWFSFTSTNKKFLQLREKDKYVVSVCNRIMEKFENRKDALILIAKHFKDERYFDYLIKSKKTTGDILFDLSIGHKNKSLESFSFKLCKDWNRICYVGSRAERLDLVTIAISNGANEVDACFGYVKNNVEILQLLLDVDSKSKCPKASEFFSNPFIEVSGKEMFHFRMKHKTDCETTILESCRKDFILESALNASLWDLIKEEDLLEKKVIMQQPSLSNCMENNFATGVGDGLFSSQREETSKFEDNIRTHIHRFTYKNNIDVILFLAEMGNCYPFALEIACEYGKEDLVYILEKKCNPNYMKCLLSCAKQGRLNLLKYFETKCKEKIDWNYVMKIWKEEGDAKFFLYCVEKGADHKSFSIVPTAKFGETKHFELFVDLIKHNLFHNYENIAACICGVESIGRLEIINMIKEKRPELLLGLKFESCGWTIEEISFFVNYFEEIGKSELIKKSAVIDSWSKGAAAAGNSRLVKKFMSFGKLFYAGLIHFAKEYGYLDIEEILIPFVSTDDPKRSISAEWKNETEGWEK